VNSSSYFSEEIAKEALPGLVTYWGYEFFKGEENYPMSMGGWISPHIFGVRTDLLYAYKENREKI
jgi:hypothetical protein